MELKRLTDCGDGFKANLLQKKLEVNGIRSLIKNEIMCGYPPMSGCSLFVNDFDLEKAKEVIEEEEEDLI